MKRTIICGVGVALSGLLLAAGWALEPAQAADGASTSPPFLVLNVQKVFAEYKKFTQLSENLKAQLESKEKSLMDMEQQIKAKIEGAKQLTSQEDRDNLQKEVQELKFDFEKSRRDARQEFLTMESDMYASCYADMYTLVEAYCKQHGYYVVLRVQDPDSEDAKSPNKILATLNREVVFAHPNLDLTQVVIDGLNQKYTQAQAQAPGVGNVR